MNPDTANQIRQNEAERKLRDAPLQKLCNHCGGRGGRQSRPFWITAWLPCAFCNGTGLVRKWRKRK